MADFSALKTAIQTYIKQNGNEEITGEILQEILLSVVTTLGDSAINDLVIALANEVAARQNADGTLQQNINNEATARNNADTALGGRIDDEATARANGDTALQAAINLINSYIPAQASSSNQLADKDFVNSSIATATATFRGSYNVVTDLGLSYNATNAEIQTALATKMAELSITPDNNDYAFVQRPTSDATPTQIENTSKYKYNGSAWAFEYVLNNSGFTAAQWAAINSGATLELIGKLSALPTNAELIELLNDKVSWTDNGAYDVTANNSGATFASLSALLNSDNLATLIPTDIRRGGMSIKYVQTSDNKYVQYLYLSSSISATDFMNTANWQPVTSELEKVKDISREEIQNVEEKIVIQDDNNNDIVTVTGDGLDAIGLKANNKRVLTETDLDNINADIEDVEGVVERIENNKEEGLTDDSIEFQDSSGNVVGTIDSEGADFKNIKKNGVEIPLYPATVEEAYIKNEEIVFENSEENPIMKISESGVKVSNITDMEGNPIVPSYEHPIAITDVIYVAVGRELCIYADSIVKSMDRGLNSPMNYRVLFNCNIGEVHDRFYRLVPTQAQIGDYTFRVRAFDMNNQMVIDKTSTLKVIPNTGLTSQKNIVFISDSLGPGTATSLFSHFQNVAGVQPNFVGTRGNAQTGKYEAYGGWRFYDFAGVGRPAYRCHVVNVDTIIKGAVYEDVQHHQFTVQETNINADGTGNISLSYISGVTIDNNTTLTKVSGTGDSTVEVTTVTLEGNNPLYNVNTAQLDIANYRSQLQLEGNIDIVCIQLGVNDAAYHMSVESIERDLEKIYNAFITDNSDCKVLVTIPLAHGNTIGGTRTNGGAAYDTTLPDDYLWKYRHLFLTKYVNNENFLNLRIACITPQLDRYYGYERWEYTISKYVTAKVTEHSNYWHPNADGYNEVAEGWVSEILAIDL